MKTRKETSKIRVMLSDPHNIYIQSFEVNKEQNAKKERFFYLFFNEYTPIFLNIIETFLMFLQFTMYCFDV